jgi:beta-phosphoglucomutase-like phosphatase (HAD superfamily)
MTDAWEIIASAKALLLDFDGPITALMPPPLNAQAAERARAALQVPSLPSEILTTTDHLAVLRFTAEHYPARFPEVERECAHAEIDCARNSEPSPEARALVGCAQRQSVPVAVVSNNSVGAVQQFRQRFVWAEPLKVLACRTPAVAARLKPDPFLVYEALDALQVAGSDCVFVGDSVTDVKAGVSAGVRVVGLAKNPQRGRKLLEAGSIALIERAR